MKIGHVHLKVRDLDRSIDFYSEFLDQRIRERVGNHFAFMSAGDMHHEVALQAVGKNAASPGRNDAGLFHAAFEVPDKQALARSYKKLRDSGHQVFPVNHRISWAIYFRDPDGNGLEIYCDTRSGQDSTNLWSGQDRALSESDLLAEL